MAARIAVVEGDLADVPALPTDIDAVVHCAGDVSFDPPVDEGFTHQRDRRARPARPDRRGEPGRGQGHPLRPHLHGVRRGPPPRQHPGGPGRPRRRPGHRADLGTRPATGRRGPLPRGGPADPGAQEGREGAQPGRAAHRGPRHRGGAQAVGQGRAGPDRHRAGPQPGLDRLLHVHQGDGRAGRRALGHRPRRQEAREHRPAEHHRVRAREAARRLDRGLQDGGAADPGLRPRRAPGVPVVPGHHRRHRARWTTSSPRSSRCWRTRRSPATSATSTSPAATATR